MRHHENAVYWWSFITRHHIAIVSRQSSISTCFASICILSKSDDATGRYWVELMNSQIPHLPLRRARYRRCDALAEIIWLNKYLLSRICLDAAYHWCLGVMRHWWNNVTIGRRSLLSTASHMRYHQCAVVSRPWRNIDSAVHYELLRFCWYAVP